MVASPNLLTIPVNLWIIGTIIVFLSLISKYVYRLTIHPLAKFPGPTLAAATNLYGASYDLRSDGSYVKLLPTFHEKYGPIVRAWPNQLHIRDMDAYGQIFKIGGKFDKDTLFYRNPAVIGGFFNIPDNKTALPRKNMFRQSFSKEAIRRAEYLIHNLLTRFLGILDISASREAPVDLSMGFSCLTADTIMNYTFQQPFGALDAPDFQSHLIKASDDFFSSMQWPAYFPRFFYMLFQATKLLPSRVNGKFLDAIATTQWTMKMCHDRILYLKGRSPSEKFTPTVLDTALDPNIEKGQFTPPIDDLTADAFTLLQAGTSTTAHTLVLAVFNILNEPRILKTLKAELREAMPNKDSFLDWASLEKLPYLHAVIKEGLRISFGAPGRLPRVVPSTGAIFSGQKIPPGTVVSSSIYVYNMDPVVFKDPTIYCPERWLEGDVAELEKYMCSFSGGSRGCLGNNLAYAELYLTLAHLFRRFDLSLYQTTEKDVEWDDSFVPITRGHLKVLIQRARD